MNGVEERIGYTFKDRTLLEKALTHSSYAYEKLRDRNFCYERLEFLGDALLNFVLTNWLYHRFPHMKEGELSKLKAALASKESLSNAVRKLGINRFIRFSRGEILTGGREKDNILADVFEAIVAAIYLDGGLEEAERFIRRALAEKMELVEKTGSSTTDYRSALQEYAQLMGYKLPEYTVVEEKGPEHAKTFTVEVTIAGKKFRGSGASKREAQQAAAKKAWENLVGSPLELIEGKFFIKKNPSSE